MLLGNQDNVSFHPYFQTNLINRNSMSNKKTKAPFPLIVKDNKEKTNKKVDADQVSQYLSLRNRIHIRALEITFNE